jgi:Glycosyltransferase
MVDYIGAGMSPLAYEEYNSLIDLGATIRLVPLVYLPSSNLNKTVIQTYNHHSLLKDFGQYILPDADKLKDNINTHEWVWAFLDKSFIKFMNYPRNPITRLRMVIIAERLHRLYKLHGYPDVIHVGMFSETALLTMFISKKTTIPYTITLHSSDFMMKGGRRLRYLKKICKESAAIITISNYNKGYLTALGVDHEKLHVIKAGINVERFQRKTDYKANNTILYVGRLIRVKGLEYLIQALKHLTNFNIKFKVRIVGEGPMENELKELATKLNVNDLVEFKGFVPNDKLPSVYEDSQVFVHPSVELPDGRRDGIPVSMMEAMSMELPVVSTYCSGIPELVEDGWNGILVKQRDSLQLAEAIRYLLENPSVAKEYGRRGREKIVREHNVRRNAEKLLNIFKDVSSK